MLKTAGIPEGIPVRLASPEQYAPPQTKPVVDVAGIAAKASNEIIGLLAEHQEQEKKAGKSFLRRRQPKPEISLLTVAESIREAVLEQYRISGAACTPPLLDLDESHQEEIAELQRQVVEFFCRDMLRVVGDDQELREQIYEICPSLRPLPGPNLKKLADLQKRADKAMAAAMAAHEELVEALKCLDELVQEEAAVLAGTSAVGSGRIKRQSEHVKAELIRLLELQEDAKSLRIPVARWE